MKPNNVSFKFFFSVIFLWQFSGEADSIKVSFDSLFPKTSYQKLVESIQYMRARIHDYYKHEKKINVYNDLHSLFSLKKFLKNEIDQYKLSAAQVQYLDHIIQLFKQELNIFPFALPGRRSNNLRLK